MEQQFLDDLAYAVYGKITSVLENNAYKVLDNELTSGLKANVHNLEYIFDFDYSEYHKILENFTVDTAKEYFANSFDSLVANKADKTIDSLYKQLGKELMEKFGTEFREVQGCDGVFYYQNNVISLDKSDDAIIITSEPFSEDTPLELFRTARIFLDKFDSNETKDISDDFFFYKKISGAESGALNPISGLFAGAN